MRERREIEQTFDRSKEAIMKRHGLTAVIRNLKKKREKITRQKDNECCGKFDQGLARQSLLDDQGLYIRAGGSQSTTGGIAAVAADRPSGSLADSRGVIEALDEAKKQNHVPFVGFTGHKNPAIHLRMLAHNYPFDTVQMPLNCFDGTYRSFEQQVLPELERRRIASLGHEEFVRRRPAYPAQRRERGGSVALCHEPARCSHD
jgi:hypothetical protein